MGMAELLLDSDLTHEQRDHAECIQVSAQNLLLIINDVRATIHAACRMPEPSANPIDCLTRFSTSRASKQDDCNSSWFPSTWAP